MTAIPIDLSLTDLDRCRSITRAVAVAVVLLTMIAATGSAQVASENSVVLAFQRATDNYAFLHRRLERRGEPLAEARQGDLFTPAVQVVLRARIERALRAHAHTAADVHAAELAAASDAREVLLRVNESVPWQVATALHSCLLAALPGLPSELEFRMVGSNLVLIDMHASLIVDVLHRAVPDRLP